DAAIATAAVLAVVECPMTGIGGDCFAIVAKPGKKPIALNAAGRAIGFLPGLATMAKQSPPIPVMGHSTTASTAAVAMAASTALPPPLSTSMAVRLPSGCEVAHIARRP